MPFVVSLTDREVAMDHVGSLFRVNALMSEHILRARQAKMNRDVDLGQGVKGVVVAVDSKAITIQDSVTGSRRTVPITTHRAAILAQAPTVSSPQIASTKQKRKSPRR